MTRHPAALLIACVLASAATSAVAVRTACPPLPDLSARVADLDRRVTALGDSVAALSAGMAALHVEVDNLRTALVQERQDRLTADAEQRRR
jgi:hypothetical protein